MATPLCRFSIPRTHEIVWRRLVDALGAERARGRLTQSLQGARRTALPLDPIELVDFVRAHLVDAVVPELAAPEVGAMLEELEDEVATQGVRQAKAST